MKPSIDKTSDIDSMPAAGRGLFGFLFRLLLDLLP